MLAMWVARSEIRYAGTLRRRKKKEERKKRRKKKDVGGVNRFDIQP